MKNLFLILSILICLAMVSSIQGEIVTRNADGGLDHIKDIVLYEVLNNNLSGINVFVDPNIHAAGTETENWQGTIRVSPVDEWFFFIDDMPNANWEHPCRYVFVDNETGNYTEIQASSPPIKPDLESLNIAFITNEAAKSIIFDEVLQSDIEGKNIYITPSVLAKGTQIDSWREVVTRQSPDEEWFFFIDDMPMANWEHPCRYVFVDKETGEYTTLDANSPPNIFPDMQMVAGIPPEELLADEPSKISNEMGPIRDWENEISEARNQNSAYFTDKYYAILLSGGYNSYNNHARYLNDLREIFRTLKWNYGYQDDHIYVVYADGSSHDLDGDGTNDIDYSATYSNLQAVVNDINSKIDYSDDAQLFVYVTNHGGQESGTDCTICLYYETTIRDDQFASLMHSIQNYHRWYVFEQCYSGGMIDDLNGAYEIVATASRYDESSWARPGLEYDEFVYHWTAAVRGQTPEGTPVDADADNDCYVSLKEAFDYAKANDCWYPSKEHPQYSEGSDVSGRGNDCTLWCWISQGYVQLDGWGGIHRNGVMKYFGCPYWPGWDIARDIELTHLSRGYYVLDGWGGVHCYGDAVHYGNVIDSEKNDVEGNYWPGWDIARDIEVTASGNGYYVLDGWGGVHCYGDAVHYGSPYWPGWDIARDLEVTASGNGYYVLDGWGGVHCCGDAVHYGSPYWPGWDIARDIEITSAVSTLTSGAGYYVLDGWGGVHCYGDAIYYGNAYWPGWDIANALAVPDMYYWRWASGNQEIKVSAGD